MEEVNALGSNYLGLGFMKELLRYPPKRGYYYDVIDDTEGDNPIDNSSSDSLQE